MAKRAQITKSYRRGTTPARPAQPAVSRGLLLGVIGFVVLVAVGLIWLLARDTGAKVTTTDRAGSVTAWGPEDAPIKIIAYSKFDCSHCAAFAQSQEPQLRAEYESTGKVRYEYRHLIFTQAPEPARGAANAAECAADQGRFWDYHDTLYSLGGTGNGLDTASLKSYAAQLGLDTTKFNACVDSGQKLLKVNDDTNAGMAAGVNATPTFFINGEKLQGAQPYSVFKELIDAKLAALK